MSDCLDKVFTAAAEALTTRGVRARHYVIPECEAYTPLTGTAADVWCLEVDCGAALRRPGESVILLFQVFDPAFPNLGLVFMGQRRVSDGAPVNSHRLPRWRYRHDNLYVYTFMPTVNDVLAPLDPTRRRHSQIVAVLHGSATAPDYVAAPKKLVALRNDARRQGQLAIIWVDFKARFLELTERIVFRPLAGSWPWHLMPRSAQLSDVRVPIQKKDGELGYFQDFSQALDSGIGLARDYLSAPRTP
ncbi:hypothetical protein AB0O76_38645 [Streptomyces sp. NPDC086554]|uniref:hypothetical protein n=1 Tax=Streptomyces sp. NPDC086554 TaxID=3154864 RepID=UPI003430C398